MIPSTRARAAPGEQRAARTAPRRRRARGGGGDQSFGAPFAIQASIAATSAGASAPSGGMIAPVPPTEPACRAACGRGSSLRLVRLDEPQRRLAGLDTDERGVGARLVQARRGRPAAVASGRAQRGTNTRWTMDEKVDATGRTVAARGRVRRPSRTGPSRGKDRTSRAPRSCRRRRARRSGPPRGSRGRRLDRRRPFSRSTTGCVEALRVQEVAVSFATVGDAPAGMFSTR